MLEIAAQMNMSENVHVHNANACAHFIVAYAVGDDFHRCDHARHSADFIEQFKGWRGGIAVPIDMIWFDADSHTCPTIACSSTR